MTLTMLNASLAPDVTHVQQVRSSRLTKIDLFVSTVMLKSSQRNATNARKRSQVRLDAGRRVLSTPQTWKSTPVYLQRDCTHGLYETSIDRYFNLRQSNQLALKYCPSNFNQTGSSCFYSHDVISVTAKQMASCITILGNRVLDKYVPINDFISGFPPWRD